MGPLYIVKDEDLFHVVWFGRRLASAPTLEAALNLASGHAPGAENGPGGMPPGLAADPTKWILTKS
jgi:hypothetical protein